jgi:acetoacetate decarboxylase
MTSSRGDVGFMFPRSATGAASIVPAPPWHYSGQMLTVEFRTEPAAVAELLPAPLEPAAEDPGAVAVIWADWQSCSDAGAELLDPIRSQYMETFVVVRCRYQGTTYSRCVYIWVDRDFAMVRGHHQGYPKKLGDLHLTRPVNVGRAGPRLAPGGRFGATCSASGRRLIDATFTIAGPAEAAGFVNSHPMIHHRVFPAIESDGTDSLHELVTMRGYDVELGPCFTGPATIDFHESPTEELIRLAPVEVLAGYWREVGTSWRAGTTLERDNLTGTHP